MSLNPFRNGTQLCAIAEMLLEGKTREDIFRAIYPLVLSQTEPFVFSNNVNGSRVAKEVYEQIPLAFYAIGRARNDLLDKRPDAASMLAPESSFDARNYTSKQWRAAFYHRVREEFNSVEPMAVSEPEPEPIVSAPNSLREKVNYLERRLYEIRLLVQSKKAGNREFDYISTRAFVHGTRAVIAGIEPDDFLVSIGLSWSADTRREAGIKDSVDYRKYAIEGTPLVMGFTLRLIEAGIPVYLYGPTGSGKSVLANKIADYLSLNYSEIALSCGVSRTDLFGNWTANGFVSRPQIDAYGNGGVFCYEEMDGADPNILLSVNNAVANSKLFNSSNGETVERHTEFIPIATANTLGNGATANFGAREGLDGSTLDRFKYGRVFVDYDPVIEHEIVESILSEYATVSE